MPSLTDRVRAFFGVERAFNPFTPAQWAAIQAGSYFPSTTYNRNEEQINTSFNGLASGVYASNPIVFACMNARVQLFSEARFQFQRLTDGRPGELFQGPSTYLAPLENPWPGGTTSQLLKDALIDADLGGNAFILREGRTYRRLRPDWVTMIAGNPNTDATMWDLDTQLLGIGYQPDGPYGGKPKVYIPVGQFAHFKSTHDPQRRFSGMPWLLPVLREINSDQAATSHKLKYFENAATPNAMVKFDPMMTKEAAETWKELFLKNYEGTSNAFKTLFLGGGASYEIIGHNLEQADFTNVQAGGELRIASAAGVPPIIIGLSGGLEAATYSNYGQARRAFADLTMRPLWRDMCGALQQIVSVPENSRLWYDTRDISFLQEDMKDAAEIEQAKASTIRTLVDAGFDAATVVDAVDAQDITRLKHSGLFSVQLQPPGTVAKPQPTITVSPVPPKELPAGRAESPITGEVRCSSCNRLLGEMVTTPYRMTCGRCKAVTESATLTAA